MPVPSFPPEGNTAWYPWATGVHGAVVTDLPAADTNLQNQITTLQNQVTTLQNQVATLQNQIALKADLLVATNQLNPAQMPVVSQLLFTDVANTAASTALTYNTARFVKVDQ